MTTFTALNRMDMHHLAGGGKLADLLNLTLGFHSDHQFDYASGSWEFDTLSVFPTVFTYDEDGPVSGTIQSIAAKHDGSTQYSLSALNLEVADLLLDPSLLTLPKMLAGADNLNGSGFDDRLDGYAGDDTIVGNDGADWIMGGKGQDMLIGDFRFSSGTAADRFIFARPGDSKPGALCDTIADFHADQGDLIDLHLIDADTRAGHDGNQKFVFIGGESFAGYHASHPGVVGMVRFDAGNHLLLANVNGSLAADFSVLLTDVVNLNADSLVL